MFLKIQTPKNGTWTYQIQRRFTSHVINETYKETFRGADFDFSSFDEETIQEWRDGEDKKDVFIMTFLDENLNEVVMATDRAVNIYLLNDEGKTIDIINRAL